jgi:hypothetical protein
MKQLLARQIRLEGRLDVMEKMEGRLMLVENSLTTSNLVQERMLSVLEQLNDSLNPKSNLPLPITERPPPPMFVNLGGQLDRLTERFSTLENNTTRISNEVTANRSQLTLVLATTNSLTAAIEGQRRELTSTRVLQQEVLDRQPLDAMPVEHEDRGLQTVDREVADRSLQTDSPLHSFVLRPMEHQGSQTLDRETHDRGFQTFDRMLLDRSTSPVVASLVSHRSTPTLVPGPIPTQANSSPNPLIPRFNALLEGLSPLTSLSSIDTAPTLSLGASSEEPETPQESVVPEVVLRRSARAASKVKIV